MDFLGIGPLELFFVMILALIIFGPNDLVKTARTVGKFMRNVVSSDSWRAFQKASKGIKDLPTTLMREAGLEEDDLEEITGMKDLRNATKDFENQISPWTTPPRKNTNQPTDPYKINPPDKDQPAKLESEIASEAATDDPSTTKSQKPAHPPQGSPFSQSIDE